MSAETARETAAAAHTKEQATLSEAAEAVEAARVAREKAHAERSRAAAREKQHAASLAEIVEVGEAQL